MSQHYENKFFQQAELIYCHFLDYAACRKMCNSPASLSEFDSSLKLTYKGGKSKQKNEIKRIWRYYYPLRVEISQQIYPCSPLLPSLMLAKLRFEPQKLTQVYVQVHLKSSNI